jgi:hypothetical protein
MRRASFAGRIITGHRADAPPVRAPHAQERFFDLLDMFKVVELEKGKPATVKSGGDERPLILYDKEFARALPKVKGW